MARHPAPLRTQLVRVLDWDEAHAGFDKATGGIPVDARGTVPQGFAHSPWHILEHLRIAQKDILAFCTDATYMHDLRWPDDYWPTDSAPPGRADWDTSLADYQADREALQQLASDSHVDLLAPVPTGNANQTTLRGILLAASHASYHLGELVAVRRALGIWP